MSPTTADTEVTNAALNTLDAGGFTAVIDSQDFGFKRPRCLSLVFVSYVAPDRFSAQANNRPIGSQTFSQQDFFTNVRTFAEYGGWTQHGSTFVRFHTNPASMANYGLDSYKEEVAIQHGYLIAMNEVLTYFASKTGEVSTVDFRTINGGVIRETFPVPRCGAQRPNVP
jgi:hypothetical protein